MKFALLITNITLYNLDKGLLLSVFALILEYISYLLTSMEKYRTLFSFHLYFSNTFCTAYLRLTPPKHGAIWWPNLDPRKS